MLNKKQDQYQFVGEEYLQGRLNFGNLSIAVVKDISFDNDTSQS